MKKIFYRLKIAESIERATRSIRNAVTIGLPEKPFASDRQMLSWVGRQFAVVFLVLLFFGDLLGFVIDVLHGIFELIHLILEFIESFLEEMLEHALHTDHHQSETIIVNAAFVIALYGLYRLYRAWPGWRRRWKRKQLARALRQKKRAINCWNALPKDQKIKLSAAYLTGIALMLYWLTL